MPSELWKQLQAARDARRLLMFAESFPGTVESYQARELAAALEEHDNLAKELPEVDGQSWLRTLEEATSALAAAESNRLDSDADLEVIASRQSELVNCVAQLSRWKWPIGERANRIAGFLERWSNHPDAAAMFAELRELRTREQAGRERLKQLELAIREVPLPARALPEMVRVAPGRFLMGAPESDDWGNAEGPEHEVQIGYSFEIAKFPVTFAQWDAARAVCTLHEPDDWGWGRDDRPVINVSWHEAQAFIGALNDKLGLRDRADRYRLPSEAEWEYACRAGTATAYSFGDDENLLAEFAWWSENAGGQTHPVGRKRPNPFGLHDMHGLIFEWCADAWHNNYDGAPTDGTAWAAVPGYEGRIGRVVRGGTWNDDPDPSWCNRSASREGVYESDRMPDVGFRLARSIME